MKSMTNISNSTMKVSSKSAPSVRIPSQPGSSRNITTKVNLSGRVKDSFITSQKMSGGGIKTTGGK